MNNKVFVDGTILVKTPFFKYSNPGCLYSIFPKDAEIIIPDDEIEGHKLLIISEDHAPSFFKEYNASGNFTVICERAPFFDLSISKCFRSFEEKLVEILEFITHNDVYPKTSQILYRLSLLSTVAAMDTLISDLILYISTKNRSCFLKIIGHLGLNSKKCHKLMERINKMWCDNTIDSAEQEVVNLILRKSYTSIKDVNEIFKDIYEVSINSNDDLDDIMTMRHLIAHRNGRRKDGSSIELTKEELLSKISVIQKFSEQIKLKLNDHNIT